MIKEELRILYKQKRANLRNEEIEKMQDLILIRFQQISLPFLYYLHTYLPVKEQNEVNTFPIQDYLKFANPGLQVVIPKTNASNRSMTHYLYDEKTVLKYNKYHIPEPENGQCVAPEDIDMVLVPLLIFDLKGYRVGYGKGYYDRFLAQCRKDVIIAGLSFFEAENEIDDINEMDIPLTFCITPQKIYEF